MVRILGNNLSNRKKVYIALTAIYGIGISTAKRISENLGIDPNAKIPDLTEKNLSELRDLLESDKFKVEGNLKRFISLNIKRLIEIGCFRGKRHLRSLPVRGQRTRTNNRTVRKQSKASKPKSLIVARKGKK